MDEQDLAEWCYEQDKLWREGKLEKWQIDKLNDIGFPFGSYYDG